MALVRNEFGIKGRVGNVVFCKLNEKSYMRSVPDRIDPNTPKQQEVRSRFRVAVRFYQKIKETLAIASKASVRSTSPASMAVASPNALWQEGRPRRKSSLSMQGRSSWISE